MPAIKPSPLGEQLGLGKNGAASADVEYRPRTLVLEWLKPPFAPGHWVPEQVALAGGDSRFGNPGAASRTTTPEEIREAPCGFSAEDTLRELPRP